VMLRLMIVDDESVIRNGLKYMIESENSPFTEIEVAADGIEALKLMDDFHPDLLITDIQMPEMDGLTLIREAQLKHVKRFVVLSGYEKFDYAREAIRLQVTDYLLKPIRESELFALLSRTALNIATEQRNIRNTSKETDDVEVRKASVHTGIRKFKAFIQQNYMRDVSMEEVAEHLKFHPNYVCNLLKREIGTTFVHYLNTIRIERAKVMLSGMPNMSMEHVAKAVGYDNTRHFYKVFKQYVGTTPGNYRQTSAVLEIS
jgi:two-component system response regulator YesN